MRYNFKEYTYIMNYTTFLNKEIISVFDGEKCGKVHMGLFNKKNKLFSFVINFNGNFSTVKTCDIFSINDNIMIRNSSKIIVSQKDSRPIFLQKEVFSVNGKFLGKVVDISINEKFVIESIITESTKFTPSKIITNNKVIVINEENSHFRHHNFTPKTKITNSTQLKQKVFATAKIPIKVGSTNLLIGKKLFRDFISKNGIVLARKNSLITSSLLNTAMEYGYLSELSKCVL